MLEHRVRGGALWRPLLITLLLAATLATSPPPAAAVGTSYAIAFPDVQPSVSSQLIGKGVAHASLPTDRAGAARTNPPDINAFQGNGAPPPHTSAPSSVPTAVPAAAPTAAPTPTPVATATLAPDGLVIDNQDPGFSAAGPHGAWLTYHDVAGQHYAASHLYNEQAGGGQDTATWSFSVPKPGAYEVYAWWWEGAWRPADVPYTLQHADGSTVVRVSQQSDGGQWNSLGTYRFEGAGAVSVSDDVASGSDIVADAVRLVYVGEAVEPQPEPQPTPTATPGKWWRKRPPWFDKRAVWLSFQTTDGTDTWDAIASDQGATAALLIDTGLSPVYALDLTVEYPETLGAITVHPDMFAKGFEVVEDQSTPGLLRLSLRRAEPLAGSGEMVTLSFAPGVLLAETQTVRVTEVVVNDGLVPSVLDPGFLGGARTFLPVLTRGQ